MKIKPTPTKLELQLYESLVLLSSQVESWTHQLPEYRAAVKEDIRDGFTTFPNGRKQTFLASATEQCRKFRRRFKHLFPKSKEAKA